jgi:GNAT superfamily N-acetyltransferase
MTGCSGEHVARSAAASDGAGGAPAGFVWSHTSADGQVIVVRPLLWSDRGELAARYDELSAAARRARFGAPPDQLSGRDLDRLLDLDYDDRFALAALVVGEGGEQGVGVARYARCNDEPSAAEVAIVVLDAYQQQGIGTLLLRDLVRVARRHGITAFTATVGWDSTLLLDAIRRAGATVAPAEPGVAAVTFVFDDERPRCQG